ncbi:MAG: hypothetical protein KME30_17280 [Iphinoe sp. HA4291-MV1]|jgi:hypothetical protein|nr:hypothetical protein [Iphinoe sp. HA4291-MV1]
MANTTNLIQPKLTFSPTTSLSLEHLYTLKPLSELGEGIYLREKPSDEAVAEMVKALRILVNYPGEEKSTIVFRVIEPLILWKNPETGVEYIINGTTRCEALKQAKKNPYLKKWYQEGKVKHGDSEIDKELTEKVKEQIEYHKSLPLVFEDVPVRYLLSDTQPDESTLLWLQKSLNDTTTKHTLLQSAKAADRHWENLYSLYRSQELAERESRKKATETCCMLFGLNEVDFGRYRKVANLPSVAHELLENNFIAWRTAVLVDQRYNSAVEAGVLNPEVETLETTFIKLRDLTPNSRIQSKDVDSYFASLRGIDQAKKLKEETPENVKTDADEEKYPTLDETFDETTSIVELVRKRPIESLQKNKGVAENIAINYAKIDNAILGNYGLSTEALEAYIQWHEKYIMPLFEQKNHVEQICTEGKEFKLLKKQCEQLSKQYDTLVSGSLAKLTDTKRGKKPDTPPRTDVSLDPYKQGLQEFQAELEALPL